MSQNFTGQELNPVTDEPKIINNQQELSVTENSSPFDSSKARVFDKPSAIADLADMLLDIECAEGLRELQKVPVFTSVRLNRATRLLPLERQQKLRQWAIQNRISTA